MLDSVTRRRIDACRDILVGKVPDPKAQVEQITIALIYKFMHDMDSEAEARGGRRSFFAGEFQRHAWPQLLDAGLSGRQVLSRYAEAIRHMNRNPGIPPLFQKIFRNAYLPYRDPATLRRFLQAIDGFVYDHSERLGDAFEYLLAVLGSQGDAGQFRTPRHLIDFMVQVLDPRKHEVILDPACGTAGFLIASYRHILGSNGHRLTPDERRQLNAQLRGYDISPDMVRLSLVNMYLHGLPEPCIREYDTLTSEERWGEQADVILANPPFMSPRGGIRPHARFAVQSRRSEVLFVDYIAGHLSPNGRAAIVVPEGIVFQNQAAHRELRRMLVQTSLMAVISLPAGVFNPYSGVKTSILVLDKRRAPRCGEILFIRVRNDGFDLGLQRRPIERNDLPVVLRVLRQFLGQGRVDPPAGLEVLAVGRARICDDDECSLSADRYHEVCALHTAYPVVRVSQVVRSIAPPAKIPRWAYLEAGRFPVIDQSREAVAGWTNDEQALVHPAKPLVVFGDHTCAVKRVTQPFAQGADGIRILETADALLPDFLYWCLRLRPLAPDGYKRHFSRLRRYCLPLPPLDVQRDVVREIESYQNVIEGARRVVQHYMPRIVIDPAWPLCPIKEVARVTGGYGFPVAHQGRQGMPYPFLKVSDMNLPGNELRITVQNHTVDADALAAMGARTFPAGTVIFPKTGAAIATNKKRMLSREATFDNNVMGLVPDTRRLLPEYLLYWLLSFDLSTWASGARPPSMRKRTVEEHLLPVPELSVQRRVVKEIEAERRLVEANRALIVRFEAKASQALARIWAESE